MQLGNRITVSQEGGKEKGSAHDVYASAQERGVFVKGRCDVATFAVEPRGCPGVGEEHPDGKECEGEEVPDELHG